MPIPPLILRIYADSSGVKKGIAQANAQVNGFRASVSRSAGLIKAAFGVAVVAGAVKAVKAAGDLGEAVNAVNVTFGKSSTTVRAWARQAATSAGLAEAEALQAAAGFGAMLDSAGLAGDVAAEMSVKVGQLAGDIGSLRNADPTDMLERMRAGLAGEAEPLRRFGIFISEARVQQEAMRLGLVKTGEELTDAQKIQARYNIILKDSAKASGDFAETAGKSLPNQLRIFRAEVINLAANIGKSLLPVVLGFLRVMNRVVGFISDEVIPVVNRLTRQLAVKLKEAWESVKPVVTSTIDAIADALKNLKPIIDDVTAALGNLFDDLNRLAQLQNESGLNVLNLFGAGVPTEAEVKSNLNPYSRRAHGGPVSAGTAYVVGERGPELFVPRASGAIIPNGVTPTRIAIEINRRRWVDQSDYQAVYGGI